MLLIKMQNKCQNFELPTISSKKNVNKQIKDYMEKNHILQLKFTIQAKLVLDCKCNSFSENNIEYPARKAIEKAANKANINHNQGPI